MADKLNEQALKFPMQFTLRVIGRNTKVFPEIVADTIRQYAPDLDAVEKQPSRADTYLSVRVHFVAESREQLDQIYKALGENDEVRMIF